MRVDSTFNDFDEFILQKRGALGWQGLGGYSTLEEAEAVLEQIQSKELPFARGTYRIFKITHKANKPIIYTGNVDPLSSNPDRVYPIMYDIPDFDYVRPYN